MRAGNGRAGDHGRGTRALYKLGQFEKKTRLFCTPRFRAPLQCSRHGRRRNTAQTMRVSIKCRLRCTGRIIPGIGKTGKNSYGRGRAKNGDVEVSVLHGGRQRQRHGRTERRWIGGWMLWDGDVACCFLFLRWQRVLTRVRKAAFSDEGIAIQTTCMIM